MCFVQLLTLPMSLVPALGSLHKQRNPGGSYVTYKHKRRKQLASMEVGERECPEGFLEEVALVARVRVCRQPYGGRPSGSLSGSVPYAEAVGSGVGLWKGAGAHTGGWPGTGEDRGLSLGSLAICVCGSICQDGLARLATPGLLSEGNAFGTSWPRGGAGAEQEGAELRA